LVVAGLPLLRRIVLAATSAGFERIVVRDDRREVRRLIDGTRASTATSIDSVASPSRTRVVMVPANVVPQARWLRSLLQVPLEPERVYGSSSTALVVETDEPEAVVADAARAENAETLASDLGRAFGGETRPLDADGCFALTTPGDLPRAETWLLRSLI